MGIVFLEKALGQRGNKGIRSVHCKISFLATSLRFLLDHPNVRTDNFILAFADSVRQRKSSRAKWLSLSVKLHKQMCVQFSLWLKVSAVLMSFLYCSAALGTVFPFAAFIYNLPNIAIRAFLSNPSVDNVWKPSLCQRRHTRHRKSESGAEAKRQWKIVSPAEVLPWGAWIL